MIYTVSYECYGQRFELRYPTLQEAREKKGALIRRHLFASVTARKVLTFTKNWSKL